MGRYFIDRIQKRHRTYDLASAFYCPQEHHQDQLRIASFRRESVVTAHLVDPPGREVFGFGVGERTLAAWGRRSRQRDQPGDNLEVMICRSPGDFRPVVAERSGTIGQTPDEGRFALTFNASDEPVVAVVEKLGSRTPASLRTSSVDRVIGSSRHPSPTT
jgi:hypothetical protein